MAECVCPPLFLQLLIPETNISQGQWTFERDNQTVEPFPFCTQNLKENFVYSLNKYFPFLLVTSLSQIGQTYFPLMYQYTESAVRIHLHCFCWDLVRKLGVLVGRGQRIELNV